MPYVNNCHRFIRESIQKWSKYYFICDWQTEKQLKFVRLPEQTSSGDMWIFQRSHIFLAFSAFEAATASFDSIFHIRSRRTHNNANDGMTHSLWPSEAAAQNYIPLHHDHYFYYYYWLRACQSSVTFITTPNECRVRECSLHAARSALHECTV